MLRKHKDHSEIVNSLFNSSIKEKKNYRKEVQERLPEIKIQKIASKTESENINTESLLKSSNSVRSARCSPDGITNYGGPKKQVGVFGQNSIWDAHALDKSAQNKTSKEKTLSEKQKLESIKQAKKQKQKELNKVANKDAEYLSKKANGVVSNNVALSNKGWVSSRNLSLFDTNDKFERLDKLQDKISPKVEKKAEVKKEPYKISKAVSSKDIQNSFINNLIKDDSAK